MRGVAYLTIRGMGCTMGINMGINRCDWKNERWKTLVYKKYSRQVVDPRTRPQTMGIGLDVVDQPQGQIKF